MIKITRLLFIMAIATGGVSADFWREGNGWRYTKENRAHVIRALTEANRAVDAAYQRQQDRMAKSAFHQIMSSIGIGPACPWTIGTTIGQWTGYRALFVKVLEVQGIGEAERGPWCHSCWKWTDSLTGAIQREIDWIRGSSVDGGIHLVHKVGHWHIDRF